MTALIVALFAVAPSPSPAGSIAGSRALNSYQQCLKKMPAPLRQLLSSNRPGHLITGPPTSNLPSTPLFGVGKSGRGSKGGSHETDPLETVPNGSAILITCTKPRRR